MHGIGIVGRASRRRMLLLCLCKRLQSASHLYIHVCSPCDAARCQSTARRMLLFLLLYMVCACMVVQCLASALCIYSILYSVVCWQELVFGASDVR